MEHSSRHARIARGADAATLFHFPPVEGPAEPTYRVLHQIVSVMVPVLAGRLFLRE